MSLSQFRTQIVINSYNNRYLAGQKKSYSMLQLTYVARTVRPHDIILCSMVFYGTRISRYYAYEWLTVKLCSVPQNMEEMYCTWSKGKRARRSLRWRTPRQPINLLTFGRLSAICDRISFRSVYRRPFLSDTIWSPLCCLSAMAA